MEAEMSKNLPQINGFEFHECIQTTAYVEIWRARQVALDRDVLIQILYPEISENTVKKEHFFAVIRSLAKIKSQVLASVLDIVADETSAYAIMEDAHSENIMSILNGQPLPFEAVCELGLKLAKGLKLLSESNLIYRNLKPHVIRLMDDDTPRLIDFSLAVFTSSTCDVNLLDDGAVIGSPAYISPEQIESPDKIDVRADIFSFGTVLYEFLTGKPAFNKSTAIPKKHGSIKNPITIIPTIPANIVNFIAKLLQRNPNLRYQTWDEVINDIYAIQSNHPLSAPDYANPSTLLAPSVQKIIIKKTALPTQIGQTKTVKEQPKKPTAIISIAVIAVVLIVLLAAFAILQK